MWENPEQRQDDEEDGEASAFELLEQIMQHCREEMAKDWCIRPEMLVKMDEIRQILDTYDKTYYTVTEKLAEYVNSYMFYVRCECGHIPYEPLRLEELRALGAVISFQIGEDAVMNITVCLPDVAERVEWVDGQGWVPAAEEGGCL